MFLHLILGVLACSSALAAPPANEARFDWADIKYLYAFGDSYTFVQGTEGLANFSFIGDAFNFSFTPQQLLSDEIIPRNTSSDGSNWPEFLTGCFGGNPSRCAPRQLWNFAFAGADIDGNLLPLHHNFTVPLVDQVQQYIRFAKDFIPHPTRETLTAWWIGINDTGDTVNNATITNFTAFWETEMTSYFRAVQSAVDNGLDGAHLFINVPPEERSPAWLNNTGHDTIANHIDLYNDVLARFVDDFEKTNPSVAVLTFDAHAWFNELLDNGAEYGFTNTTGFCTCTDPAFFWYNTGHPTQHVHELLAKAIERSLEAASISA